MDKWWVPGLQIGFAETFVHQLADFLRGLDSGKPAMPNFKEGLRTQQVCECVLKSAKEGTWVKV